MRRVGIRRAEKRREEERRGEKRREEQRRGEKRREEERRGEKRKEEERRGEVGGAERRGEREKQRLVGESLAQKLFVFRACNLHVWEIANVRNVMYCSTKPASEDGWVSGLPDDVPGNTHAFPAGFVFVSFFSSCNKQFRRKPRTKTSFS